MNLLKSTRFQGILVVALLQALVVFNVITGVQAEALTQIIQSVIVGAVAVGTLDRVGKKA